jgi:H+-translocating NAD(P) transhydrogenase subunit alpha
MKIGVTKGSFPGERRVALIPANLAQLTKLGLELVLEAGAGTAAGFTDAQYTEKGGRISDRAEALSADIVVQVRALGANREAGQADVARLRAGQTLIGMCDPLGEPQSVQQLAATGVSLFALEMLPRITRAQSMDVLSSMATIAGYRAVLLGAVELPKMFPLLMTAAGTLTAAKVFVIGAGVAGLQALGTARRPGAVVQAYDVRPAVREQVESMGARFVELELDTAAAEDRGGYAKQLGEEFYQKQRELMARVVADSDVVITTAAIPGKPSPRLITADAVRGMRPGSVIIDLAAERGGNCELTRADERIVDSGVTILGPTNLSSEIPNHASQMYSNNVTNLLKHIVRDGGIRSDADDEIIRDTVVARGGEVVAPRIRDLLGLAPLASPAALDESSPAS